jgi:hypothetical protein
VTFPADLPLYVSGASMLAFVWKASSVSARMDASLAELRAMVGEVKTELGSLRAINERLTLVEHRVGQLEDFKGELAKKQNEIVTRLASTDKARAVTQEQIRAFKEQSSPDLSRYVTAPEAPRRK